MQANLLTVIVRSLGCPTCKALPGYGCLSRNGLGADPHAKRVARGRLLLTELTGSGYVRKDKIK